MVDGFIYRDNNTTFRINNTKLEKLFAYYVINFLLYAVTALLIGIIALIYGLLKYNINNLPNFYIPEGVEDKVKFCVVGNMHNFSYIGGIVGMLVGIIHIIVKKRQIRKAK
jgi:hypothetical protein